MRRALHFFFFFIFSFSAFGQSSEQSLGEITVEGAGIVVDRFSGASQDSVSFTSVINVDDYKGRKTSVPEILQEESGVQIRRYSGLDDFATISIRGSTSEQVSIYLDGILLNQGVSGVVNLSTIPLDQIDKIEVYKGSAPARFGSSSIGGVVNIITKKADKKESFSLSQSFGSFKTYESHLLYSQNHGKVSNQVGYSFTRSSGDFSYLNDNGTPFNQNDDQTLSRANNEFARHNVLTKLGYTSPNKRGLSFHWQNHLFYEDRGIPGMANQTSETANLGTIRNGTSLELKWSEALPGFDVLMTPYFQYLKSRFVDRESEIGLSAQDNDDDSFQYGSALQGHLLAGRHQKWNLNAEYRGEQYLPEDFSETPSAGPKSSRNSVSFSLEDEIFLWSDKLVANPSVRSEHVVNDFAETGSSALHPISAKMGLKYSPFSTLTAKTNFSRSYRIPNFTELFGDRGSLTGNPNLVPETGLNWDIGFLLRFPGVTFQSSYFLNHVDNLIQFLQSSQSVVQARNLSKARIQGVETNVSATFWDHLDLAAGYTFQLARDISGLPGRDGHLLPGRPVHEFETKATVRNRMGQLFVDLNFIDDNFLDSQNILRVDSRLLMNMGGSVSFLKKFTVGVETKNLLNNRVADVVGFPLPGRSYYAKLEVKI